MYRLNAVTIHLPPLRERREDILQLAEHFAREVASGSDWSPSFSEQALMVLEQYEWPGNIRELENAILHAVSLSEGVIYPEHLPLRVQSGTPAVSSSHIFTPARENHDSTSNEKWRSLSAVEQDYVLRVLEHTGGNKQAASRILEIDRKTLARIADRSRGDE